MPCDNILGEYNMSDNNPMCPTCFMDLVATSADSVDRGTVKAECPICGSTYVVDADGKVQGV